MADKRTKASRGRAFRFTPSQLTNFAQISPVDIIKAANLVEELGSKKMKNLTLGPEDETDEG